jgi:hypothetical protein
VNPRTWEARVGGSLELRSTSLALCRPSLGEGNEVGEREKKRRGREELKYNQNGNSTLPSYKIFVSRQKLIFRNTTPKGDGTRR